MTNFYSLSTVVVLTIALFGVCGELLGVPNFRDPDDS